MLIDYSLIVRKIFKKILYNFSMYFIFFDIFMAKKENFDHHVFHSGLSNEDTKYLVTQIHDLLQKRSNNHFEKIEQAKKGKLNAKDLNHLLKNLTKSVKVGNKEFEVNEENIEVLLNKESLLAPHYIGSDRRYSNELKDLKKILRVVTVHEKIKKRLNKFQEIIQEKNIHRDNLNKLDTQDLEILFQGLTKPFQILEAERLNTHEANELLNKEMFNEGGKFNKGEIPDSISDQIWEESNQYFDLVSKIERIISKRYVKSVTDEQDRRSNDYSIEIKKAKSGTLNSSALESLIKRLESQVEVGEKITVLKGGRRVQEKIYWPIRQDNPEKVQGNISVVQENKSALSEDKQVAQKNKGVELLHYNHFTSTDQFIACTIYSKQLVEMEGIYTASIRIDDFFNFRPQLPQNKEILRKIFLAYGEDPSNYKEELNQYSVEDLKALQGILGQIQEERADAHKNLKEIIEQVKAQTYSFVEQEIYTSEERWHGMTAEEFHSKELGELLDKTIAYQNKKAEEFAQQKEMSNPLNASNNLEDASSENHAKGTQLKLKEENPQPSSTLSLDKTEFLEKNSQLTLESAVETLNNSRNNSSENLSTKDFKSTKDKFQSIVSGEPLSAVSQTPPVSLAAMKESLNQFILEYIKSRTKNEGKEDLSFISKYFRKAELTLAKIKQAKFLMNFVQNIRSSDELEILEWQIGAIKHSSNHHVFNGSDRKSVV